MATINHISMAAKDPQVVAERLAKLTGGHVKPFHPLDGAFACMWSDDWSGSFVEVYPSGTYLKSTASGPQFQQVEGDHPNATHINLSVEKTEAEIVAIAEELGLVHSPRGWGGIYDVWVEDGLLVELTTP